MSAIGILVGEGIECERESARFFAELEGPRPQLLRTQDLLRDVDAALAKFQTGDWIFLPGGFSFADHFGSGRLLSHALAGKGFFELCLAKGLHLMGVCNGFQVLAEAGLFGPGVSLEANRVGEMRPGFVNRWVTTSGRAFCAGENFTLPVRHGEGRLVRTASQWADGVEPFLAYEDANFENGSLARIAGLVARRGGSCVVGMMPHPEIAARAIDAPDTLAVEWPVEKRAALNDWNSDGARIARKIFAWAAKR